MMPRLVIRHPYHAAAPSSVPHHPSSLPSPSPPLPFPSLQVTIELIAPVPMAEGLRFAVREGGKTVGAGVVAKILE